jgi:integrase
MKMHFTDVSVQRLHQSGTYWDDTTPGFGVRVGKHRKTWIIMRGQIRQRVRIGHYPATSLADARKQAKKLLLEAPTRNAAITFQKAYDEYELTLSSKKPRTQAEYKRLMRKHFVPKIGRKRLPELQYEQVIECVAEERPGERDHALAVCRAFFRWCVKPPRRYLAHSPIEGVEIKPSKRRRRILKPEELKSVWQGAGKLGYPYGALVQLLILNGQRRNETANLRRSWINEKERLIVLPDWITKNGREHTIPYGDLTAEILAAIPRFNSTDLLFPSRYKPDRPLSGWSKFKKELDSLSGVKKHTLHDLRRTFRTTHGQVGTPPDIAERLVNHISARSEMEETYDLWTYLPQMRSAVTAYEHHLETLLARAA